MNKPSRNIPYGKNYSKGEYIKRLLWSLVWPLFRFSPRLLYGWRNFLLRLFGACIGKDVKIYPSASITFPWNLEIGDQAVISWGVKLYNLGRVTIGRDTIVSQYTHICAGNHDYTTPDFKLLKTPITVGNHVWIAADVFVGPGVRVGDNSVVLARSVLVKDVEPRTVVAGHPAKAVKQMPGN
jgi:putative colanic acid biosynthesis acetyltransferase WcaF